MRVPKLLPVLTSAFLSVSGPIQAEGLPINLFDQSSAQPVAAQDEPVIVDLHAVLLADVSTSMGDSEIRRGNEGLFEYLVSDEARADYAAGARKAVTVVYFADDTLVRPTIIISSVEDAQHLIDEYLERQDYMGMSTKIEIGDGHYLEDSTDVHDAILQAGHIFANEADIGIQSERRTVVLVGDGLYINQFDAVRRASDEITRALGVRFCAVAVHDEGTTPPQYDHVVTSISMTIENEHGYSVPVQACEPVIADTSDQVKLAVANVLGMPRY